MEAAHVSIVTAQRWLPEVLAADAENDMLVTPVDRLASFTQLRSFVSNEPPTRALG